MHHQIHLFYFWKIGIIISSFILVFPYLFYANLFNKLIDEHQLSQNIFFFLSSDIRYNNFKTIDSFIAKLSYKAKSLFIFHKKNIFTLIRIINGF